MAADQDTSETPPLDASAEACVEDLGGAAPVAVGTVLGARYALLEFLGQGANGAVFEAEDLTLGGEHVAVKVLIRKDLKAISRLKHEFRALSQASHPKLVGLRSLERHEHRWFIVMDLVRGTDFLHYVRPPTAAHVDEPKLRHALPQLIDGVAALHAQGKLHGDLKPSNVLVRNNGELVIVDFGLVSEPLSEAGTQWIVGTPAYLAPEQACGQPAAKASDLYAIGVMLYEALVGELPFCGPMLLRDKVFREPPAIDVDRTQAPPDLVQLCEVLLAREPDDRPFTVTIQALMQGRAGIPSSHAPRHAPFIGRARELAELGRLFAGAPMPPRERIVLVHGTSGVGKTALCAVFAQRFEREHGAIVLRGRCRAEELVPFNAFDEAIDQLAHKLSSSGSRPDLFAVPADADALVRLFPALASLPGFPPLNQTDHAQNDAHTRPRAFAALRSFLATLARSVPLLLVIDDLQWADADSTDLLHTLLSTDEPVRPWVLATSRGEERASADIRAQFLPIGALQDDDARGLVRAWLGPSSHDHALERSLLEEAQGSPFFLGELSRHLLAGGGPSTMESVLSARIGALDADTRRLLEVVCLSPRPLPITVAVASARCAVSCAHALRRSSFLRANGNRNAHTVEPYHDHIREAVAAAVPIASRGGLYLAIAKAGEALVPRDAELLFECYRRAGDALRAAAAAIEAATAAERVLAFHPAIKLLQYAQSSDDPALRDQANASLARVLTKAGRIQEAAVLYEQLAARADHAPRTTHLQTAMLLYFQGGHFEAGHRLLQDLCKDADLPYRSMDHLTGRLEVAMRLAIYRLGGLLETELPPECAPDKVDLPAQRKLELAMLTARGLAGYSHAANGSFALRGLELTRRLRDRRHWPLALSFETMGLFGLAGKASDSSDARAVRVVQLAGQVEDVELHASVLAIMGWYYLYTARLTQAVELFTRAEAVLSEQGLAVTSVCNFSRTGRLFAWYASGHVAACAAHRNVWLEEAEAAGDVFGVISTLGAGGAALLREDAPDAARDSFQRALSFQSGMPNAYRSTPWWHAEIELYAGTPERAREAFNVARADPLFATRAGNATLRALIDFSEARVALASKYTGYGEATLATTHSRLRHNPSPLAHAFASSISAGRAFRRGNESAARDHLRECATRAGASDMHLLGEVARLRLAEIDSDSQGETTELSSLRARGIRNPARWVAMVMPGYE